MKVEFNKDSATSQKYIPYFENAGQQGSTISAVQSFGVSNSVEYTAVYQANLEDIDSSKSIKMRQIETIAQWFLYNLSMSNKKLQKLCYYAYCWFIVFNNDIESAEEGKILTLCEDKFQAWIHGPVCPKLYYKYRGNGWSDIPKSESKPQLTENIESLLCQVLSAYGDFTADELENLSHTEMPWKNARIGVGEGEACTNEISTRDILLYYTNLR